MVSFIIYDLIFLVLFTIAVIVFLYMRRKNLQRQGLLYLYRTKLGIKFIDKFAKRFFIILRPLKYIVITSGYILMVAIIWLLVRTTYLYLTNPLIAKTIKAPPIAPLIPYFPTIFGLDAFFPPLYFTYFLVALAIIAVVHEASHGIYARLHNIKIHSTGLVFLGPILGAFVEQDDKDMEKAKKIPQLAVLAAGTFANVITALIFGLIMIGFFNAFFVPAGVHFVDYSQSAINLSNARIPENFSLEEDFVEIVVEENKFYASPKELKRALKSGQELVIVYDNSPAFNARLQGAIMEIGGIKVYSNTSLSQAIQSFKPGDEVNIKVAKVDGIYDTSQEIENVKVRLDERNGKAFLGIGITSIDKGSITGLLYLIRDPFVYYESILSDFGWFVYYLLWWIVLLNILVAVFNMLPVSILDGGRFFMLTMWGITKNKKFGERAFKWSTVLIALLFIILMLRWLAIVPSFFGLG